MNKWEVAYKYLIAIRAKQKWCKAKHTVWGKDARGSSMLYYLFWYKVDQRKYRIMRKCQ